MSVYPEDSKKGRKEDVSELERKREELYENRVSEDNKEIQRTRESQRSWLKRLKELGDTNNVFFSKRKKFFMS